MLELVSFDEQGSTVFNPISIENCKTFQLRHDQTDFIYPLVTHGWNHWVLVSKNRIV